MRVADEFACEENIQNIKVPRRPSGHGIGRAGYSSSSDDNNLMQDQHSGEENY